MSGVSDHLWVVSSTSDTSGRSTRADPQWLALTGQTAEEALGYGWLDAVHPEDRPELIEQLLSTLALRAPLRHEFRVRRKDGEYRWALGIAAPRFDDAGVFLGYAASMVDIHASREAEASLRRNQEALRLAHERLTATLRASPVVVFEQSGEDLRFLWMLNPPPGLAAEEIVGRTDHDLLPCAEADLLTALKRGVIETGVSARQEVRLTIRGEVRWYDVSIEPHRKADVIDGVLCTATDITDRKVADTELQRTQDTLAIAVDAAQMGTWDADLGRNGSIVRNLRHDQIYGHESLREKWTFDDIRKRVVEDDRDVLEAAFKESRRTGRFETEVRVRWPDGSIRWMASRGRLRFDANGKPIRASGVNFDITALKAAEQALKDADRRKDEFLAILGHELRNPLTPILNGVHALQRRLRTDASERERALLDMMRRQTGYLVRLVDDLLELSRVNSGVIELHRRSADIASAVRDALEVAEPLIEKKGHAVELRLPDQPLIVFGDPMRLAQVVANLVTNAAKYTGAGGRIVIVAERRGAEAVIRVRDDGIGIAPAALPRLFDLFARIDGPAMSERGLGVGLALAKKLVALHGGSIEASSGGLGEGAEFTVVLPLDAGAPPEAKDAPEAVAEAARPLRLLVVDDNHDVADSMAMLLESIGGEIRVAYDGSAGIDAAAEFRPDIAFVDLRMPHLDGYETARRIRERLGPDAPRLIALSGAGDKEGSLNAGFDVHLTKPVSAEALETLLREAAG